MFDAASLTLSLRPGTPVSVNGRKAVFLYARRSGAVVRYEGERRSRVVSLEKLQQATR